MGPMSYEALKKCIPDDVVEAAKKVEMDAEALAQLCIDHTVDAVRDFLNWASSKLK